MQPAPYLIRGQSAQPHIHTLVTNGCFLVSCGNRISPSDDTAMEDLGLITVNSYEKYEAPACCHILC
jgi:hypothetical protein